MAVLRAYIPASVSTMTRTCWLFISISVIAALAEATDLLSRCPSQVPRNSYLKATPWGKCYQFHMEERTWKNANHICASKGGHLVTIKEERVQSFLVLSLAQYRWPRNGLWIGATDQENEMDWRWVTGERVKDGYSRWASGQPSCGFFCFEDCAVMRWKEGGRWHDYRCNWLEDYSFICEYDMEPEPTTTTTTTTTTTSTTTTTTTPTTTTTVATTTTTEPTTLESLESEYLVHNHAHEEEEAINETTAILPPSVLLKGEGHAVAGQVQGHSTSSSNLGSGTITALIVSLLTTLAVGLCCLIFLIFRRRRRKQLTEQVGISYENPYYAETKTPLAAAADDNDDDEEEEEDDDGERYGACGGVGTKDEASTKIAVERSSKLKPPPPPSPLNSRPKCVMNTYDSPPSLSTHKPVTTAAATKGYKECNKKEDDDDVSLEEENHYDEIHSLQVATHSTYDVPKSSISHKVQDDNMENFYYNDNEEENLYESVDNLRAMVDQRRRLRLDDTNQDQEEEARYVPFALDSSDPVQANN